MSPDANPPRGRHRMPQILASAASGFAEKGYDAASVADLTSWTQLGRGALYRQIGSKSELLQTIAEQYVSVLEEAVALVAEATVEDPPREALVRWTEAVFRTQAEHFDFARVFFNERRALDVDVARRLDERLHAAGQTALDAIDELTTGPHTGHAFLGMVFGSYLWFRPDDDATALAADACAIFLDGIASQ